MSGLKPGVAYHHVPAGQVLLEGSRPAEHWALALVAGFASLQECIASALHTYIQIKGAGHVANLLNKRHFSRLSDDERWDYVKALAKDVGFDRDIQEATDVFWRCKRTRDVIGHAPQLSLLYDPEIGLFRYESHGSPSKGVPDPLTPATLRLLTTQSKWLDQFVCHLLYRGGGRFITAWGHQHEDGTVHPFRVEIPDPGPVPNQPDWDPPTGRTFPCEATGCTWKQMD